MKHLKNISFFSCSFSEKSGRVEYGIYSLACTFMNYLALDLLQNVNLDNEKILNIFYSCLILLLTFVPMQAVTTRRLNDLTVNPTFVIFNFIPILNLLFAVFLLLVKKNLNNKLTN